MKYKEDDFLQLSGIQHFSFCKRQWSLIHIEQQWKENFLTAEGIVNHERVHDTNNTDIRNGIVTIRGLDVKSYELGISGTCDAVEFSPSENGVMLHGRDGRWIIKPVEYKHGKSKANDCDRLQATAQAMCLEEMFCCNIKKAAIYYCETRRRETFEITDELRKKVTEMLDEMHDCFRRGYTFKAKQNKNCKSCSLSDLCIPEIYSVSDVKKYVKSHLEEEQ